MVARVELPAEGELLVVAEALDAGGFGLRLRQRGQKHPRENRDDGDDDEEFDEGEAGANGARRGSGRRVSLHGAGKPKASAANQPCGIPHCSYGFAAPLVSGVHAIAPIGVAVRRSTDVVAVEDAQLAIAVRHLNDHFTEVIKVDDLARLAGMSRTRLERQFRIFFGRSPYDYALQLRLRRARELLAGSDLLINEVGARVGFSTPPESGGVRVADGGVRTPRPTRSRFAEIAPECTVASSRDPRSLLRVGSRGAFVGFVTSSRSGPRP